MADQEWYWNLKEGRAVPAAERSRSDVMMGPYPTREAAEAWREIADARNDTWQTQDEAWADDTDTADAGSDPDS